MHLNFVRATTECRVSWSHHENDMGPRLNASPGACLPRDSGSDFRSLANSRLLTCEPLSGWPALAIRRQALQLRRILLCIAMFKALQEFKMPMGSGAGAARARRSRPEVVQVQESLVVTSGLRHRQQPAHLERPFGGS